MLTIPEVNKVAKSTGARVTCGTYHSHNFLICRTMSVTKVLGTVLGIIMEMIQQVFHSFPFLSFFFLRGRALEPWLLRQGLFAFD